MDILICDHHLFCTYTNCMHAKPHYGIAGCGFTGPEPCLGFYSTNIPVRCEMVRCEMVDQYKYDEIDHEFWDIIKYETHDKLL